MQTLKLENAQEWFRYCKGLLPGKSRRPPDIPANPRTVYSNEWVSWGDWLGTGRARHEWIPFEEAREFVHGLKLKSQRQWFDYVNGKLPNKANKPTEIPNHPVDVYADEWVSWGDWLGTGRRRGNWRPFKEARALVHRLDLSSQREWFRYVKGKIPIKGVKPEDIPASPHLVYGSNGWKNWGDWLGTGTVHVSKRKYREFKIARQFVQGLDLKSGKEWVEYAKGELAGKGIKPDDIPANPRDVYLKKGWEGMGDWLGTGRRKGNWREFKAAREFVHTLGLKSETDWRRYRSSGMKPADIPVNPDRAYRNQGWVNWPDWLGKSER